ncbi:unnamed protein product [Cyprideis torosa]|uniref:Uncharacterized protein n=1 Tax=Cyprideis torosa TaxID=163714 RepID=A0A7R8W9X3_9CRUS|nr:unnamed protein product [Cyprideis torosa]CAG0884867.1 unnamed protein product [Cyprideis torosa]
MSWRIFAAAAAASAATYRKYSQKRNSAAAMQAPFVHSLCPSAVFCPVSAAASMVPLAYESSQEEVAEVQPIRESLARQWGMELLTRRTAANDFQEERSVALTSNSKISEEVTEFVQCRQETAPLVSLASNNWQLWEDSGSEKSCSTISPFDPSLSPFILPENIDLRAYDRVSSGQFSHLTTPITSATKSCVNMLQKNMALFQEQHMKYRTALKSNGRNRFQDVSSWSSPSSPDVESLRTKTKEGEELLEGCISAVNFIALASYQAGHPIQGDQLTEVLISAKEVLRCEREETKCLKEEIQNEAAIRNRVERASCTPAGTPAVNQSVASLFEAMELSDREREFALKYLRLMQSGLKSIRVCLVLFLRSELLFQDAWAAITFHMWTVLVFAFPMVAFSFQNSYIAKNRVIVFGFIMDIGGGLAMLMTATRYFEWGTNVLLVIVGLLCIALGSGTSLAALMYMGSLQYPLSLRMFPLVIGTHVTHPEHMTMVVPMTMAVFMPVLIFLIYLFSATRKILNSHLQRMCCGTFVAILACYTADSLESRIRHSSTPPNPGPNFVSIFVVNGNTDCRIKLWSKQCGFASETYLTAGDFLHIPGFKPSRNCTFFAQAVSAGVKDTCLANKSKPVRVSATFLLPNSVYFLWLGHEVYDASRFAMVLVPIPMKTSLGLSGTCSARVLLRASPEAMGVFSLKTTREIGTPTVLFLLPSDILTNELPKLGSNVKMLSSVRFLWSEKFTYLTKFIELNAQTNYLVYVQAGSQFVAIDEFVCSQGVTYHLIIEAYLKQKSTSVTPGYDGPSSLNRSSPALPFDVSSSTPIVTDASSASREYGFEINERIAATALREVFALNSWEKARSKSFAWTYYVAADRSPGVNIMWQLEQLVILSIATTIIMTTGIRYVIENTPCKFTIFMICIWMSLVSGGNLVAALMILILHLVVGSGFFSIIFPPLLLTLDPTPPGTGGSGSATPSEEAQSAGGLSVKSGNEKLLSPGKERPDSLPLRRNVTSPSSFQSPHSPHSPLSHNLQSSSAHMIAHASTGCLVTAQVDTPGGTLSTPGSLASAAGLLSGGFHSLGPALYVPEVEEIRMARTISRRGYLNFLEERRKGWQRKYIGTDQSGRSSSGVLGGLTSHDQTAQQLQVRMEVLLRSQRVCFLSSPFCPPLTSVVTKDRGYLIACNGEKEFHDWLYAFNPLLAGQIRSKRARDRSLQRAELEGLRGRAQGSSGDGGEAVIVDHVVCDDESSTTSWTGRLSRRRSSTSS